MGISLRPWVADDMELYVRLRMQDDPWVSVEALRQSVDSDQRHFLSRWVAEEDGEPVGTAHVMRYTDEPDYMSLVVVDRARRGRGIGRGLFSALLDGPRDRSWLAEAAEGPGADVARHWGFEEIERSVLSRLALRGDEQLEPGVRVMTSEDIVAAGLAERVDACVRLASTNPEAVELGWVMTVAWALTDVGSIWALLEHEGRIVATSYAAPGSGGTWMVMWCGVVPDHRGRGAARAVKRGLHAAIAARGGTSVLTGNEAMNTPMRTLNASLGYVQEGERVRLRLPVG